MIIVELHGLAHFAPSNHFIRGVMTGLEEVIPWGGGAMTLVCILKCLVSVFINASRRCRKLNENSLSLLEF